MKLNKSFYIGKHFFDKNTNHKFKPSFNHEENIQEVNSCPLCGSKNHTMVGKFEINALIDTWITRYKFNPIPDIYRDKILEKKHCAVCGLYFYNYHLKDSEKLYEKLMNVPRYYTYFRGEYGTAAEIIKNLQPNSVLEIGSGNGGFLERIQNLVPKVTGCEYNKKAAKLCSEKGLKILTQDITSIEKKFDVICHFEVLEHIFDTKNFIKNNLNLLKPEGKLIIGTPDPEGILCVNGIGPFNLPPHHQFDFSKESFEFIAKMYNLNIFYYQKSELEYKHYKKYTEIITGQELTQPDMPGYLELKKEYTGHSHIVVFEKKE
jgi:2-polyprenyl-3-methyl-5-hydroxy-6-metoxy-1,4-benzoquinol methylase